MQRIINKMKKTPFIDESTGEYNLKYNIQNLTEDFFMPVRGGDSGTEINELGGIDYDSTEDIEYLKNKGETALKQSPLFNSSRSETLHLFLNLIDRFDIHRKFVQFSF